MPKRRREATFADASDCGMVGWGPGATAGMFHCDAGPGAPLLCTCNTQRINSDERTNAHYKVLVLVPGYWTKHALC